MPCHSCRSSTSELGRLALSVIFTAFVSACGPGQVEPDGVSTTSPSSETDPSTTETGADPSTTSEPNPTTMGPDFVPESDDTVFYDCDSFLQDCPEGEKCVPYGSTGSQWDAQKCVPILGDQGVGEPCVYDGVVPATDDCDASSYCWNAMEVEGELVGTCHALCTGSHDAPMCPPGSNCSINGDGTITLCIPTCDPLAQDCEAGLGCYWSGTDFSCIFTTEDIPAGEPCGYFNDCMGGNLCVNTEDLPACEGSACCAPYCDLDLGDGPCAVLPGTSCVAFFPEGTAPDDYEHIGVCIVE